MTKVIIKAVLGLIIGILFFCAVYASAPGANVGECLLCVAWGIGIVGGFSTYIKWLGGAMNWSLKLGVLALISFGSGIIGFILLLFVLGFILMFGWLYGWYALIKELIAAL